MSILNAWVSQYRALVAVDTTAVAANGARFPTSKIMMIPHLNAALALRGQETFLQLLCLRCISSHFATFDALDDALPGLLEGVDREVSEEFVVKSGVAGTELVAVGWSDRRERMLMRQCVKHGGMPEFKIAESDFFISPWDASMSDLQRTPDHLETLARAQVHWIGENFPDGAYGGELLVCGLTRTTMSVQRALSFEEAIA